MIELPNFAVPGSFTATLNDAGFTQSGVQSDDYIPRKGSRYTVGFTFGPYDAEQGRIMVARLVAGKQGGVKVRLPLLHSQGSPGAVTIATSVSTGRVIEVQGGTPGYICKEGYWLSLENADGQHFLHSVAATVRFSNTGTATITLGEMVRDTFATGRKVNLAKPMVQGLLAGDEWSWQFNVNRVIPIEFTLKETK